MRAALMTLGLLLLWGVSACTSQEERIAEHRGRAQEYFEKEQWNEAKIEYLNLLRMAPDDAEVPFLLPPPPVGLAALQGGGQVQRLVNG